MPQGQLLHTDLGTDSLPDDGLEDGEEENDGQVIELAQSPVGFPRDLRPLEGLQFLVLPKLTIPGKSIPMEIAQALIAQARALVS